MDILLMIENTSLTQAFKLKGRLYTFTVLQVHNSNIDAFTQQITETVSRAPKMFEHTPVVFDLSAVKDQELDLGALLQITRNNGMVPVAIQSTNSFLNSLALANGLALLHASASQDKTVIETPVEVQAPVSDFSKTKLLITPVRSGQQFVAKGADLIVASSVSHGAELLADGSIHVYGALRGRALAGISGDRDARIFCQSLDAELLSIAGFYRVSDTLEPHNGPCQIYLKDEHIQIEPL